MSHILTSNPYPVPPIPVGTAFRTPFPFNDIICILRVAPETAEAEAPWYAVYTPSDNPDQKQTVKIAEADEVLLDVRACSSGKDARQVVYVLKQKSVMRISLDPGTGKLQLDEKNSYAMIGHDDWSTFTILGVLPKASAKADEQIDLLVLGSHLPKGTSAGAKIYIPDLNELLVNWPFNGSVDGMALVQNNLSQQIVFVGTEAGNPVSFSKTSKLTLNLPNPLMSTLSLYSIDIGVFLNSQTLTSQSFDRVKVTDQFITIPCKNDPSTDVHSLAGMFKGFELVQAPPSTSAPRTGRFLLRYGIWTQTVAQHGVTVDNINMYTTLWTLKVEATTSLNWLYTLEETMPAGWYDDRVSETVQTDLANLSIVPLNFVTVQGWYAICHMSVSFNPQHLPQYPTFPTSVFLQLISVTEENTLQNEVSTAFSYQMQFSIFYSCKVIINSRVNTQNEEGSVDFIATGFMDPEFAEDWRQGQNIRRISIPLYARTDGKKFWATFDDQYTDKTVELTADNFPIWIDANTSQYASNLGLNAALNYMLSADFSGNGFTVGTPTLIETTLAKQIFAVYQTPPFERALTSGQPILSLGTTDSTVNGLSATTHKSWSVNVEVSFKDDFPFGSVSAHLGVTYGKDFMESDSTTTSTDLHVAIGISQNDALHGILQSSYLWEYPVFKGVNGVKKYTGVIAIVFPYGGLQDSYFPSTIKDFNYNCDYEVGSILTYVGAVKTGYQGERDLSFELINVPVTDDASAGTSIHYSSTYNTHKDSTYTTHLAMNAGTSVTLGPGTVSANYNNSTTKSSTTSTTTTKAFSLSIITGSVKDAIYEYQLTPYIYQSSQPEPASLQASALGDGVPAAPIGMLFVKYDLELTGPGWSEYFAKPDVVLFRVYPDTSDVFLNAFSRSIRFQDNIAPGRQDVSVSLFNKSLNSAKNIVCELYLLKPTVQIQKTGGLKLTLDAKKMLTSKSLEAMGPVERSTMTFYDVDLGAQSYVSVRIYIDDDPDSAKIYWGIYPYAAFGQLQEALALD